MDRKTVIIITLVCAAVTLLCILLLATDIFGLRGTRAESAEGPEEAAAESAETAPEPTEQPLPDYAHSPEYLAASSWQDYCREYDPDGSIRESAGSAAAAFGEEFGMYQVYTQDMADRLTLLGEQYGLTLRRSMFFCYSPEELYEALGVPAFLPQGSTGVGYCFDDRSFFFEGESALSSGLRCAYQLQCVRRGSFTETILTSQVENGVAWDYTAPDGTALRLSMGTGLAAVFAQLPGAFVCLSVPAPGSLSAAGLEELAGTVDWSSMG